MSFRSEGTLMSLDNLAIPKDAPHVAEAYLFIDYLLRPDVAARNTKVDQFRQWRRTVSRADRQDHRRTIRRSIPMGRRCGGLFTVTLTESSPRRRSSRGLDDGEDRALILIAPTKRAQRA